jgi:nicotinate-nucleotide adenylyltransferase
VFGGTFDPVHNGHLAAAVNVRERLGLDTVLLVVANIPWQKTATRAVTPAEERLAVVEAAIEGVEGLEASRLEIDRGGPSYTADTLAELARLDPAAELYLIVGSDLAPELSSWERVEEVRRLATLVVAARPGSQDCAAPRGWRQLRVEVPGLDISSSDLRARVAAGRPLDFLVPPAAIRCIQQLGLYAGGG